jgi:hypothetical protein
MHYFLFYIEILHFLNKVTQKERKKERKRKKIKKLCSIKILYCNKSQALTSYLTSILTSSKHKWGTISHMPTAYVGNMHKMLLFASILRINYFIYTFTISSHFKLHLSFFIDTYFIWNTHVSLSKKNSHHLVCQTTSVGNHMLLNYGINKNAQTYDLIDAEIWRWQYPLHWQGEKNWSLGRMKVLKTVFYVHSILLPTHALMIKNIHSSHSKPHTLKMSVMPN